MTEWPSFLRAQAGCWHRAVVDVDAVRAHQSLWSGPCLCSLPSCSADVMHPGPTGHEGLQHVGSVASELVHFSVQLSKPVASGCCCPARRAGDSPRGRCGRGLQSAPPERWPQGGAPPHAFVPPCGRRVVLEPGCRPALRERQAVRVLAWLTVPREGMADVDGGVRGGRWPACEESGSVV